MQAKPLAALRQRRDELVDLNAGYQSWSKVQEWHTKTRPLIAQCFSTHLEPFDRLIVVNWAAFPRVFSLSGRVQSDNSRVEHAERQANETIAKNTRDKLVAHLDAILELADLQGDQSSIEMTLPSDVRERLLTNRVFVVHGHDEEIKQHVARTLSQLGLDPIILHEQPNAGRTIIEKFEHHSDVSFAIVLLSPDDMAFPAGESAKKAKARARQNVVLELGFFIGSLGRDRVFTLKRGENLELPSDVSGVIYTPYDSAGHWRFELVRELKKAGYTVDANNIIQT